MATARIDSHPMNARASAVLFLFFVSGLCGLIYESVWTHYVKLFLGHAAYAQTLVLVVFVGGLALGSYLCARMAQRIANPLRVYAAMEAAIGFFALVFHPIFLAAVEWGYRSLLPSACEPGAAYCMPQWALAAALLAPQSILLGAALLTGLSSFIYEIAWVRMLSLVLGASTHAFELMLASFILGLAFGGLWIRRHLDTSEDPMRLLGVIQIVMGILAALSIPIYNGSFDLMAWLLSALDHNDAGYVLFNLSSTLIALLVMLPTTFCAGTTLPLVTYRLLRSPTRERSLGLAYSVNTAGCVLGVVITVHFLLRACGLNGTLLIGALIDAGLGALILLFSTAAPRRAQLAPALGGLAMLTVIAFAFQIDVRRSSSGVFRTGQARLAPNDKIAFHRDGKTATVDVLESRGTRAIRTNGKTDAALSIDPKGPASGDEYTMVMLSALPLAHHPDARTAPVIGLGPGRSTAW